MLLKPFYLVGFDTGEGQGVGFGTGEGFQDPLKDDFVVLRIFAVDTCQHQHIIYFAQSRQLHTAGFDFSVDGKCSIPTGGFLIIYTMSDVSPFPVA